MTSGRMQAALPAAALLLLAPACERDEANDGDIFLRDVPEREAPLRPPPDLADIRPAPDLRADEKALAMICSAGSGLTQETCGCFAGAAAATYGGRDLAYFAARLIGDEAEAFRAERGLPDEERVELDDAYVRFLEECSR